jgi:hypothetical protein
MSAAMTGVDTLTDVTAELIGGAGGIVVGKVLGFVLPGLLGLDKGEPSPSAIEEVKAQLTNLQSDVNRINGNLVALTAMVQVLSEQILQLTRNLDQQAALTRAYNTYTVVANNISALIDGPLSLANVKYAVSKALAVGGFYQGQPTLGPSRPPPDMGYPQGSAGQGLLELQMQPDPLHSALATLSSNLASPMGLLVLWQNLATANVTQYSGMGAPALLSNTWLSAVWSEYGSWFAKQTQILWLIMEILHLPQGGGPKYTRAIIEASTLAPLLRQQQQLMPVFQQQIQINRPYVMDTRLRMREGKTYYTMWWGQQLEDLGQFVKFARAQAIAGEWDKANNWARITFRDRTATTSGVRWVLPTEADWLTLFLPSKPPTMPTHEWLQNIGFINVGRVPLNPWFIVPGGLSPVWTDQPNVLFNFTAQNSAQPFDRSGFPTALVVLCAYIFVP